MNLTRQYIQLIGIPYLVITLYLVVQCVETVCLKKEVGGNESSEEMQTVAMATKDRGKKIDVLSDLALCLLHNTVSIINRGLLFVT